MISYYLFSYRIGRKVHESYHVMILILLLSFGSESLILGQMFRNGEAITFGTSVTGDFAGNFHGGLKTGYTYIGIETISLELDFEKTGLWKNGLLYVSGLNSHGKGPSENLTGDLQLFSNIEAGDFTGMYELWYQQRFGDFTLLLGLHDLNSEFAGTKYGETFINSSFGIAPNISLNVPVSVYPVTSLALVAKYDFSDRYILKYAVYDGDPGNFESNRYNLEWSISKNQGYLNIGELQHNIIQNEKLTGIYRLGAYLHTGTFTNYSDTLSTEEGNYGLYFSADQSLFNRSLSAARGLCFFVQAGIAPARMNMVQYYLGGGLRYHGILPYRYYDEIGLAFASITLSDYYMKNTAGSKKNETAIELTYKFQFGQRYWIQPSMQYIINPGANRNTGNSLSGLVRFTLSY